MRRWRRLIVVGTIDDERRKGKDKEAERLRQ